MVKQMFLTEKEIFPQIKTLLRQAKRVKCAVAFWGEQAPEALGLPYLNGPAYLICNFESGATNPEVIRQLRKLKNVQIRSLPRLHAKVYWTESGAIIGSSNASANGLSFENEELRGWFEANMLITNENVLRDIETWFDKLWSQANLIDEALLKEMEEAWCKRRDIRPPINRNKGSLLAALKKNRDDFKDRNILIVIYRLYASPEANKVFENWRSENSLSGSSQVDFYEGWDDLPPGATVVDLYYGPRGGFECTGLWSIPDPLLVESFRYDSGDEGYITMCFKRRDYGGLTIKPEDKALLQQHIEALYRAAPDKSEDGAMITLYDAWPILFDN